MWWQWVWPVRRSGRGLVWPGRGLMVIEFLIRRW